MQIINERLIMIKVYKELEQGSQEWFDARCGILTASEMRLVITPKTLKFAKNEKQRSHLSELAAQRCTGYVEPSYVSDDMIRGHVDEDEAIAIYNEHYAETHSVGFITNDKWGFTLGYSPDDLVGDDGLVECKSRRQKFQFDLICGEPIDADHIIQMQTGLLVSERKWCDYISYCAGMHMVVRRVYPDDQIQDAIIEAADHFHINMNERLDTYKKNINNKSLRMIETERVSYEITASEAAA
jgi:hypothetical protein